VRAGGRFCRCTLKSVTCARCNQCHLEPEQREQVMENTRAEAGRHPLYAHCMWRFSGHVAGSSSGGSFRQAGGLEADRRRFPENDKLIIGAGHFCTVVNGLGGM